MTKIVESLQNLAVPLNTLTLDPANARTHSQRGIESIAASLATYGQRTPIVAQKKADGTLIVRKGNGTTQAARSLGWETIAAVIVEESDTTATGYAIADNRTGEFSTWDFDVLEELLGTLEDEELYTGFDETFLEDLGDDFDPIEVEPDGDDEDEALQIKYRLYLECSPDYQRELRDKVEEHFAHDPEVTIKS